MPILRNQRHELFAHFVAIGKPATDAYACAGFSPGKNGNANRGPAQSASRLLRTAQIQARIAELSAQAQQSRATKVWLDREFVIEGLKRNLERAMQETPVLDHHGKPSGEYRYDGSVANKSLELLGKELGMFVERSELSIREALERASADEVEQMHTELAARRRAALGEKEVN